MTAHIEQWRPVVGHEGEYEVSDLGRVRSVDRVIWRRFGRRGPYADMPVRKTLPGVLLKPQEDTAGYLCVNIGGRPQRIQWLVAAAFIGPRPAGAMVLHGDDRKHNNQAQNLRYGWALENAADALRNGRTPVGERHYAAKLTAQGAAAIRALHRVWPQAQLASLFGVAASAIQGIHDGRTWKSAPAMTPDEAKEWIHCFGPIGTAAAQEEWDRHELIWGPSKFEDQHLAQEAWAA